MGSPETLGRADLLEFCGPVKLFSAEHLAPTNHEWAFTASSITTPTGRARGVLDVSLPLDTISADTLRKVRCAGAESLLGLPYGGTSTVPRLPCVRRVSLSLGMVLRFFKGCTRL